MGLQLRRYCDYNENCEYDDNCDYNRITGVVIECYLNIMRKCVRCLVYMCVRIRIVEESTSKQIMLEALMQNTNRSLLMVSDLRRLIKEQNEKIKDGKISALSLFSKLCVLY